eukprot:CAMPEP_0185775026 /NCGR_PEP_ID=MMETSP1174-20130828/80958_1 /TAXON_ID=35687 /ORGANISM="Dictyocha speculum, Strain CCMP1381" /LENGTH=56 /DNA_ID=CAMNT_0028462473 /DNA_START=1 /DNA_END=171 /DNA_ORIENTATION=+
MHLPLDHVTEETEHATVRRRPEDSQDLPPSTYAANCVYLATEVGQLFSQGLFARKA